MRFFSSSEMISILVAGLLLCGCDPKTNPDLQAPPEERAPITVQAAQSKTASDPKVNVLFVVDNSGSMEKYQSRLVQNINLFAKEFFANNRLDYRIGVVPIYDSKYLNDQTVYRSGKRKMNPLGELVQLKGVDPSDTKSKLYITRETVDPERVLEQTVHLGTQWGPEAEESFSPVLAVADPTINHNKNDDFYQKDAYFAIIFLTDADDVTPGLSGMDFYQRLVDLKGGDESKILIATANPDLNNHSATCTKDGFGPVESFPALRSVSGAIYADLCSPNFGARLAEFGKNLVNRAATQRIALGFTPDITTLKVTYGPTGDPNSQYVLHPGADGYYFDPTTNEVELSPTMKVPPMKGAVISVQAIPARLGNAKNGHLRKI